MEVVDGVGVGRDGELSGGEVHRAEVIDREKFGIGQRLAGPVGAKAQPDQCFGVAAGTVAVILHPVLHDERPVVVLQKFQQERVALARSAAKPAGHLIIILEAEKGIVLQKVVQRADQLDVGIHINAAVLVQNFKAGVVGHKGPLFPFQRLFGVKRPGAVVVLLVPLDDLVVRTELLPAFDTGEDFFRFGVPAKPAVVERFGNAHRGASFRKKIGTSNKNIAKRRGTCQEKPEGAFRGRRGTKFGLDCPAALWYTERDGIFQSIHPNFTEISKLRCMIT